MDTCKPYNYDFMLTIDLTHLNKYSRQRNTTANTSPAIVSRLWNAGTIAVFPLSFLTGTCKARNTTPNSEP
jgi:hypothetical protein